MSTISYSTELENKLVGIEKKLWTNDADFYANNLLEEAQLVFGETGVISRDAAVDAIRKENKENRKWAEVEFDGIHMVNLTPDVALLTYKVSSRWEHESSFVFALATSVYLKRDGKWKLASHQQTPINSEQYHLK